MVRCHASHTCPPSGAQAPFHCKATAVARKMLNALTAAAAAAGFSFTRKQRRADLKPCLQTHSSSCCATAGKDKLWSWNHTTLKLLLNIHWLVSSNLLFGFLFFFFPLIFSLSCMPILTRPLGHKCTTLMRHNREACSSFDDSELLNNGTVRAKPQHTHSEWNQISRLFHNCKA